MHLDLSDEQHAVRETARKFAEDYIGHALLTEEIGKACSSVRTTISVQISLVELSLARWGTEEQKRRYLPELCSGKLIGCFGLTEPNAGSDPSSMEMSAVADGDH